MKHLKTMIAAFVFLIIAVSCKKQTVNLPEPTPITISVNKKLQKIIWAAPFVLTQNYFYDTQGRLIKYDDENITNTWTYGANTVAIKEFRKSENRFVSVITGATDNAGRVTNLSGNYSYNINVPYTEQTVFTYDVDGYLKQFIRTSGTSVMTYDYTVTNGDYTKLIYQKTNASGYTRITDFFTDKLNLTGIGEIPIGPGTHTGLFGKLNKHLIKSDQSTLPNVATPSWTYYYTYILDNNGYTQTFDFTGTSAATGTYTFQ